MERFCLNVMQQATYSYKQYHKTSNMKLILVHLNTADAK